MENKQSSELDHSAFNPDNEISATEELPDEVTKALESVPEDKKKIIEEQMFSFMQMGSSISSPETEVMKKLTSEHLTVYMDIMREDMQNRYAERKHNKVFAIVALILLMAFVIGIIILLKSNPNVMEKVIYAAGGLIAGALGGYGFGKRKS